MYLDRFIYEFEESWKMFARTFRENVHDDFTLSPASWHFLDRLLRFLREDATTIPSPLLDDSTCDLSAIPLRAAHAAFHAAYARSTL